MQVAGRGGIPGGGAAAVVATVTVTGPQGGGHLTVWPSGVGMPGTSKLNFQAGQTVANTVIVRLGADGWIHAAAAWLDELPGANDAPCPAMPSAPGGRRRAGR